MRIVKSSATSPKKITTHDFDREPPLEYITRHPLEYIAYHPPIIPIPRSTVASAARVVSDRLGLSRTDGPRETSWQVLRHRQFRRYFAGSLVSNFGTWLQNTAQLLLAYRFTHSVLAVGLMTMAQFSSPLLLGSWAGVFADRFGSRRTLYATQLALAIITGNLAALQFAHMLGERSLLAGAFVTGLLSTFAIPAQSITVTSLVPSPAEVRAAVAMNSVSYNAGRAMAPAFSILIITSVGAAWAFTLNAVSFGIFIIVFRTIRPRRFPQSLKRSRVRDGFRIVRDERKMMFLLLMVAMITVADDPILVLGPAVAHHSGVPDNLSGYFLSALGAGSVLGSMLPRQKTRAARRAAAALAVLSISTMIFALAPWFWVSVAAAFAAGVAGLEAGSTAQSMLIGLAGPERAMRVMGLWTVAWAGTKPIASLIDGSLAALIGVKITGVTLALPALIPLLMLVFCPRVVHQLVRPRCSAPVGNDLIQAA